MTDVVLGFKAFDIHELLCHFVAQEAGLYAQQGLNIKLIDTNFVPEQSLPEVFFSVACGAALVGWLNGVPQKIMFVVTDKPLFWLYSRADIDSIQHLQHCRIATYVGVAPPSYLLNAILAQQGLDLRAEVENIPARDDIARIGLLKSGNVDAAVVSSAVPPAVMMKYDFKQLLFFGEHVRIPTTGLAIQPALKDRHPEVVAAMVDIFTRSLQLIKGRDVVVQKVLARDFDIPLPAVSPTVDLLAECFCHHGQSSTKIVEGAIKLMKMELQCSEPPIDNALYDFSFC